MEWKFFTAIVNFLHALFRFGTHKRNVRAVKAIVQIYTSMKELVGDESLLVCHCAVFKAENGGKNIKPGSQLYLTCLYEEFRPPSQSSMIYQRVHMDGEYMKILLQAMQGSPVYCATGALSPDCLPFKMNDVQGLTHIQVHYIYDRKGAIYYCVVGTGKGDVLKQSRISLAIETAISQIRKEIKTTV